MHQVHGFRVDRVDTEESRREKRKVRIERPGSGTLHDEKVEEEEANAESQEQEELVEVKSAARQAVAEKVIDCKAKSDKGAVRLVLWKRASRPDVSEELTRVRQVADIEVVDDDVAVVEMKRIAEDVAVRREEKSETACCREGEGVVDSCSPVFRGGHGACHPCWAPAKARLACTR